MILRMINLANYDSELERFADLDEHKPFLCEGLKEFIEGYNS